MRNHNPNSYKIHFSKHTSNSFEIGLKLECLIRLRVQNTLFPAPQTTKVLRSLNIDERYRKHDTSFFLTLIDVALHPLMTSLLLS